MFFWIVLTIHVLLCTSLVGLVLLQHGKGADSGAITGAGNADSFFGAGGAGNILSRSTTTIAVLFMVTSLLLIRAFQNAPVLGGGEADPLQGSVVVDSEAPARVEPAAVPQPESGSADAAKVAPPAPPPAAPPAAAVVPPPAPAGKKEAGKADSGEKKS